MKNVKIVLTIVVSDYIMSTYKRNSHRSNLMKERYGPPER